MGPHYAEIEHFSQLATRLTLKNERREAKLLNKCPFGPNLHNCIYMPLELEEAQGVKLPVFI